MTFNIHHANPPGLGGHIDLQPIINLIKKHSPDLVALQEVDVNTNRSNKLNQPEILANKLNMHVRFGKTIDFDGGEYGLAILSKFPIHKHQVIKLPSTPASNAEPRILQSIQVQLSNQLQLRFGNTHLDAQKANTNRLMQVQAITEITQQEKLPFILTGDLNAPPNSKEIALLKSLFAPTCSACVPTYPAENPTKIIDYILYHSPEIDMKVTHHRVLSSQTSDHRPVISEFLIISE